MDIIAAAQSAGYTLNEKQADALALAVTATMDSPIDGVFTARSLRHVHGSTLAALVRAGLIVVWNDWVNMWDGQKTYRTTTRGRRIVRLAAAAAEVAEVAEPAADVATEAPAEVAAAPAIDNSWADGPARTDAPADHEGRRWSGIYRGRVSRELESIAKVLPGTLSAMTEAGDDEAVLDLISWATETRRVVGAILDAAEEHAGRRLVDREGVMPDGRAYKVRRGQDRKAWDHEGWKHDVRAEVIRRHLPTTDTYVDTTTGEVVDLAPVLYGLAADLQEVHGSTAPKVTKLRALGLEVDGYCQTFAGRWKVDFEAPEESVQANS